MFAMFWNTFKAWAGTFVSTLGAGLGPVIISAAEKASGYDIPPTTEAWLIGIIAAPFVWLSVYFAKNS